MLLFGNITIFLLTNKIYDAYNVFKCITVWCIDIKE